MMNNYDKYKENITLDYGIRKHFFLVKLLAATYKFITKATKSIFYGYTCVINPRGMFRMFNSTLPCSKLHNLELASGS